MNKDIILSQIEDEVFKSDVPDTDLIPIELSEQNEFLNVFEFLNCKPMQLFLRYPVGDDPRQIYYFRLDNKEDLETLLSLLKKDKAEFESLCNNFDYESLDRFKENDALGLENTLLEGTLTPKQCLECGDLNFNQKSSIISGTFFLKKFKEILSDNLIEADDNGDYLALSPLNGNGASYCFCFDLEKDMPEQYLEFCNNLDYEEILENIIDIESSYCDEDEEVDKSYCETCARNDFNLFHTVLNEVNKIFPNVENETIKHC